MMPIQKPGRSVQSVETPDDFMEAFAKRFGAPDWDLAADEENTKAKLFYGEQENSLKQEWFWLGKTLWLNPPYEDIEPWAKKCALTMSAGNGCKPAIYMLIPASVGSNYFAEWIQPFAYVLGLSPRLKFKGHKTCYPKDLILCCYQFGLTGFDTWRWKP